VKVMEGADAQHALLSIVVKEGRNRQVRNMCEAVGHPVDRLRRVRIGPITDEHIRPGEFRELDAREVAALKRSATGTKERAGSAKAGPGSVRQTSARRLEAAARKTVSQRTRKSPVSLGKQGRPKADQAPHRPRGR